MRAGLERVARDLLGDASAQDLAAGLAVLQEVRRKLDERRSGQMGSAAARWSSRRSAGDLPE
jgi:hypothetical protein